MKTFMGYRISDESTNPRVPGAKFIQVRVGLYREVDAAKELLEAAVYKDHSLQAVQARVQKMRELCLSSWFEHAHYPYATFHLQGSCAEGHWYALHFECSEFHAETLKILTKLKAAAGSGGDRLERLIAALQGAGGVEVGSVEISYDGRRDWMDCRKDELDAAKRRAEQAQEFNQITN